MKKLWRIQHPGIPATLEELRGILLQNRGISNPEAFFSTKHPLDLTLEDTGIRAAEMEKAISRLKQARANEEDVLVFGDYDADGISATAILWLTLHHLGYKTRPFIPHRAKHGYGISNRALDEILAGEMPDLIVTVDNGIVAHGPAARIREAGIDLIITDHHQPETDDTGKTILPKALAVVHTTKLCGATVAWMLARELDAEFAASLLDLATIATIADQVPLVGANRSFAKHGLEALKQTKRPGLQALFKAAKIEKSKINTSSIGFGIAPRINAMGRLEHGMDALRLLCTNNKTRAADLADTLVATNLRRQDLTDELMREAIHQAEQQVDEKLIIVSSHDFHDGIIGLLAGRLTEQFYKPAIAISLNGGVAKASARSVAGVNIVELIREVQDELLEVGGHPMAAGFGLEMDKLDSVLRRLFDLAKKQINPDMLIPSISIDCQLPYRFITEETVDLIETLAPFGQGNDQPVFELEGVAVDAKRIGQGGSHLKLLIAGPDMEAYRGQGLEALVWRQGGISNQLGLKQPIKLAGYLEFNHWNGNRKVQMVVREVELD
jgi:single-stranded-DNA-specific exonuclease